MSRDPLLLFHTVCRVAELPEGQAQAFTVAGHRIGVFHTAAGFSALADACPHAGASLAQGLVEDEAVRCRIHHWRFSLRDGRYLDENRPSCNARTFPVRIVGEEVQVGVEGAGG